MKKVLIVFIGLICFSSVFAGVIKPDLKDFNRVRISGEFNVVLKKGDETSVEIKNTDKDLEDEKIICEVKEGELRIRIKGDTFREYAINVMITYTSLKKVIARLGSKLEFKSPIEQSKIDLLIESGAHLKARVMTDSLIAEATTGAEIFLDGKTSFADYEVSAGATLGAIDVKVKKAITTVTAGGDIICWVTDDLKIKITTGGTVTYFGDPSGLEEKITLGGTVKKLAERQ